MSTHPNQAVVPQLRRPIITFGLEEARNLSVDIVQACSNVTPILPVSPILTPGLQTLKDLLLRSKDVSDSKQAAESLARYALQIYTGVSDSIMDFEILLQPNCPLLNILQDLDRDLESALEKIRTVQNTNTQWWRSATYVQTIKDTLTDAEKKIQRAVDLAHFRTSLAAFANQTTRIATASIRELPSTPRSRSPPPLPTSSSTATSATAPEPAAVMQTPDRAPPAPTSEVVPEPVPTQTSPITQDARLQKQLQLLARAHSILDQARPDELKTLQHALAQIKILETPTPASKGQCRSASVEATLTEA
ncbi:hypothetical protein OC846_002583 [Tilletia horrida]|uniref:Uncharacterized protein n=1 Tax=Tilletia horrida TaxID=155126 RepID=A0AAN6GTW2_9BASI|nr:hypothetical protein OC845_006446 [Tilletia horrida]KAK0553338.1 hypothetical protein OC846_002583 [Tilletia horrida]KAK0567723.1 hypothetical protein OC861_002579 [Tilletia horrida]